MIVIVIINLNVTFIRDVYHASYIYIGCALPSLGVYSYVEATESFTL